MSATAFLSVVVASAVSAGNQPASATKTHAPGVLLSLSTVGLAPEVVTGLRTCLDEVVANLGAELVPAGPLDSTCQTRPACLAAAIHRRDAQALLLVSALRLALKLSCSNTRPFVSAGPAIM